MAKNSQSCWRWPEIAVICWKGLEWSKWLEMAGNDGKQLKCLEIDGNDCKWIQLEMAVFFYFFLLLHAGTQYIYAQRDFLLNQHLQLRKIYLYILLLLLGVFGVGATIRTLQEVLWCPICFLRIILYCSPLITLRFSFILNILVNINHLFQDSK